ncbi:hypothetical protein [Parafrigoribacterium soli]|uniref:hypothetical protein n=1 Tax=Parafrigoribacterium soli TaxID=3144663 RepID=UPI0032ED4362
MATVFGFFVAKGTAVTSITPTQTDRVPRLVLIGVVLSLLLLIPFSEIYSGFHLWQIGEALFNQGEAFSEGSKKIAEGTNSRLLFIAIQVLATPFTMCAIPFLALSWFERRKHLLLFLAAIAVPVTSGILVGRDFQVISAAVLVICSWLVSRMRRRLYFSWKDIAVLAGAAALYLVVFALRKLSRSGAPLLSVCPPGVSSCPPTGPPTLWDSISVYFSSYASQSYEGLGRALDGHWQFGGGYSHSGALRPLFDSILGVHHYVITDQLVKFNWSATDLWSTGLAWLANDIPWILVPLVVALQGVFLALVWRKAIEQGDWLSVTLFGYTWLSLFFMMQNLQLAISGPLYLGYIALAVIFLAREVRQNSSARPRLLRRRQDA